MAKYFDINEFTYSETAFMKGINNMPDDNILGNIYELMETLDGFREYYGKPIRVSSGYRCPELNRLVGGVSNSAHLTGYAADLLPIKDNFKDFCSKILEYFKDKDFDLIIIEKNKKGSRWVHFSMEKRNRKQTFSLNNI